MQSAHATSKSGASGGRSEGGVLTQRGYVRERTDEAVAGFPVPEREIASRGGRASARRSDECE